MNNNPHMTSPAEDMKDHQKESEQKQILPARLGFIKHSDAKTTAKLKKNFIDYLSNMNSIGGFNKKDKWPKKQAD